MYPKNDTHFEDTTITKVTKDDSGWSITQENSFSFWVKAGSPIEPKEGMAVRFYGKGIGFSVRGLFLNEVEVYYRTENEDAEHREVELYGVDATDWLTRWDTGKTVWTIEMGGMGPGYEQAIHITCAEVLRHLLEAKYNVEDWEDSEKWKRDRDLIHEASFKNETIEKLGLSGAQFGAALDIAGRLYRDGPRYIMNQEAVKDRHIQVSKNFPNA